jgi:ABC-type multidrug transport system permease subunit
MKPESDRPEPFDEAPESDSARKFIRHIIDEMPWRVVAALAFVAFFFSYGAVNSFFKLTGRELASLSFPLGPYVGLASAVLLTAWVIKVKRRPRR